MEDVAAYLEAQPGFPGVIAAKHRATLGKPPVRLKPAATRGNTTLTADSAFFRSEHVGALFRLTHDRFDATFGLGGAGEYTNPWRVSGIKETTANFNDREFSYATTGTWVPALPRAMLPGRPAGTIRTCSTVRPRARSPERSVPQASAGSKPTASSPGRKPSLRLLVLAPAAPNDQAIAQAETPLAGIATCHSVQRTRPGGA